MSDGENARSDGPPEKRQYERLAVLGHLAGDIMVPQPIAVTEIGDVGVQIVAPFPLQLNSLHDLRIKLETQSVVVNARVVHCTLVEVEHDAVRYRIGLEFVDVPDRVWLIISAYLEAQKRARKQAT
jgi:hypothetical protein